jgi:hypothetical protein
MAGFAKLAAKPGIHGAAVRTVCEAFGKISPVNLNCPVEQKAITFEFAIGIKLVLKLTAFMVSVTSPDSERENTNGTAAFASTSFCVDSLKFLPCMVLSLTTIVLALVEEAISLNPVLFKPSKLAMRMPATGKLFPERI